MVVVVIVAIIAVAVTLSFGARGFDPQLDEHGRRLATLLELAGEEATLQAREYGIEFHRGGYLFHAYEPDVGEWLSLADDRLLRARALPQGAQLELRVEGRDASLPDGPRDTPRPQVLLLSSGEITPFRAVLSRGGPDRLIITADAAGRVETERETRGR